MINCIIIFSKSLFQSGFRENHRCFRWPFTFASLLQILPPTTIWEVFTYKLICFQLSSFKEFFVKAERKNSASPQSGAMEK